MLKRFKVNEIYENTFKVFSNKQQNFKNVLTIKQEEFQNKNETQLTFKVSDKFTNQMNDLILKVQRKQLPSNKKLLNQNNFKILDFIAPNSKHMTIEIDNKVIMYARLTPNINSKINLLSSDNNNNKSYNNNNNNNSNINSNNNNNNNKKNQNEFFNNIYPESIVEVGSYYIEPELNGKKSLQQAMLLYQCKYATDNNFQMAIACLNLENKSIDSFITSYSIGFEKYNSPINLLSNRNFSLGHSINNNQIEEKENIITSNLMVPKIKRRKSISLQPIFKTLSNPICGWDTLINASLNK